MDVNELLREEFANICRQIQLDDTEDPIAADLLPMDRADNYFLQTPAEPTRHPPGSQGKIEVMAERAARNLDLWHELDAPPWH